MCYYLHLWDRNNMVHYFTPSGKQWVEDTLLEDMNRVSLKDSSHSLPDFPQMSAILSSELAMSQDISSTKSQVEIKQLLSIDYMAGIMVGSFVWCFRLFIVVWSEVYRNNHFKVISSKRITKIL